MSYPSGMTALKSRPRMTIAHLERLPEGSLAELIDGELLMTPAPFTRHQIIVGRLHVALAPFVERAGSGRVLLSPTDVYLPGGDVVQPDLLFVSTTRLGILRERVYGAPDLLIEVLSPGGEARDRLVKRARYAAAGVGEYWIVDPDERSIERLRLAGSAWEPGGWFRESDALGSDLLPGFSLPLGGLFAE